MENMEMNRKEGGESPSIEEMFGQLEEILRQLENGDISLEDSFEYYENGMKLVRECQGKLDRVEKKILVLNGQEKEEQE